VVHCSPTDPGPSNATGYDQFMNIVLDNTVEIVSPTEKNEIGMVVIRGGRGQNAMEIKGSKDE